MQRIVIGGKPSTATPADRRLRENRDKPPRPMPGKPMKPGKP